MKEQQIKLDTIDKVKAFAKKTAFEIEKDIKIASGDYVIDGNEIKITGVGYVIDGKSIMGIFSLDLSKPLALVTADDTDIESLREFFYESPSWTKQQ